MTAVLDRACAGEPAVGDAVEDIFRRAERLRRRRARTVIVAGLSVVLIVILLGYALTTVFMPGSSPRSAAAVAVPQPRPSAELDPVLAVLSGPVDAAGYRIVPRLPSSGLGWRQYTVLSAEGQGHGIVTVVIYDASAGLCLPVASEPTACARPDTTTVGIEYARYADTDEPGHQVHEVIARRVVDGRTVAVQVAGERGHDDAGRGRPALTTREAARIATQPRLFDGFGLGERCNAPAPSCPELRFPVRPVAG